MNLRLRKTFVLISLSICCSSVSALAQMKGEAAEDWARQCGCKRIVVTTALQRAGAHAFYERLAYAHTGRRYGKDFPPGGH